MGLLLKNSKRPQNLEPLFTVEKLQKKAFLLIKGKIEEETFKKILYLQLIIDTTFIFFHKDI